MISIRQIMHLTVTIASIVLLMLTMGFAASWVYADDSDYNTHTIIVHNSFHTFTDQQLQLAYTAEVPTFFAPMYPWTHDPGEDGSWISPNDFLSAEITSRYGEKKQLENNFIDDDIYEPMWSYNIGDEETLELVIKTDKRFAIVESFANAPDSPYSVQIEKVKGLDSGKQEDRNSGSTVTFKNDSDRTIEIWLKAYPKVADLNAFLNMINTLKGENEQIIFNKDWKGKALDQPVTAELSWELTKDEIERDARALNTAMKGLGCDEESVYTTLMKCRFYLDPLASTYYEIYNRELFPLIKSELGLKDTEFEQLMGIKDLYDVQYDKKTKGVLSLLQCRKMMMTGEKTGVIQSPA